MKLGRCILCMTLDELNFVLNNLQSEAKVIVLDDEILQYKNFISGSILLPPPSALITLLDNNDQNGYAQLYANYLSTVEVDQFIMLLMTVLLRGKDIVFYLNSSDPSLFLIFLQNWLYQYYGLVMNNVGQFSNNCMMQSILPQFYNGLIQKSYSLGYLKPEQYSQYYQTNPATPFNKINIEG